MKTKLPTVTIRINSIQAEIIRECVHYDFRGDECDGDACFSLDEGTRRMYRRQAKKLQARIMAAENILDGIERSKRLSKKNGST